MQDLCHLTHAINGEAPLFAVRLKDGFSLIIYFYAMTNENANNHLIAFLFSTLKTSIDL